MIEIYLCRAFGQHGYNIWLHKKTDNGQYSYAKPAEFNFGEPISAGHLLPAPTLFLPQNDYQTIRESLLHSLMMNGAIVSNEQLKGELTATKYHLEDLRKLVLESKRFGV